MQVDNSKNIKWQDIFRIFSPIDVTMLASSAQTSLKTRDFIHAEYIIPK